MYSKSVVTCNPAKYTKWSNNLLECVFSADLRYVSDTGNEWVCKTCDRALKRGIMPLQAKANGSQLSEIAYAANYRRPSVPDSAAQHWNLL